MHGNICYHARAKEVHKIQNHHHDSNNASSCFSPQTICQPFLFHQKEHPCPYCRMEKTALCGSQMRLRTFHWNVSPCRTPFHVHFCWFFMSSHNPLFIHFLWLLFASQGCSWPFISCMNRWAAILGQKVLFLRAITLVLQLTWNWCHFDYFCDRNWEQDAHYSGNQPLHQLFCSLVEKVRVQWECFLMK
jgi:hypothetical protein